MEDIALTPLAIPGQDGERDHTAINIGLVCSRYDSDWNTN